MSGGNALGMIGSSMERFTDAMINVLQSGPVIGAASNPLPSAQVSAPTSTVGTPRHRRQLALTKVEQEPELTSDDCLDLIEMFERDYSI